MKFLHIDNNFYIAKLVFRKYGDELILSDMDAKDLMNNDYEIKCGDPVERWHHDSETGRPTSVEYKDLGTRDFYLGCHDKCRISKRELDRLPQTQRKLARILDKRLCESFNEEIKELFEERNRWRGIQANYGTGGLKSQFGEDWKQQFDNIKKERQNLQLRRDALRHVHYDQIVTLQKWREKDGKDSHKWFTIIDTNTDLDDLIEKQQIRANKSLGVKMSILIDDDFFDAVCV